MFVLGHIWGLALKDAPRNQKPIHALSECVRRRRGFIGGLTESFARGHNFGPSGGSTNGQNNTTSTAQDSSTDDSTY